MSDSLAFIFFSVNFRRKYEKREKKREKRRSHALSVFCYQTIFRRITWLPARFSLWTFCSAAEFCWPLLTCYRRHMRLEHSLCPTFLSIGIQTQHMNKKRWKKKLQLLTTELRIPFAVQRDEQNSIKHTYREFHEHLAVNYMTYANQANKKTN